MLSGVTGTNVRRFMGMHEILTPSCTAHRQEPKKAAAAISALFTIGTFPFRNRRRTRQHLQGGGQTPPLARALLVPPLPLHRDRRRSEPGCPPSLRPLSRPARRPRR